jgi:hypothetical protein
MAARIAGTAATTTGMIRDITGNSGQGIREITTSHPMMLNGPCHMHYTYIGRKRVSNHAMKDYRTFIKLQEAVGSKQAEARNH